MNEREAAGPLKALQTLRNGRYRFKCVDCGMKISGRLLDDGRIVPYDRGPDINTEPIPMVCVDCVDKKQAALCRPMDQ